MELFFLSFFAGVLTILAPCVLPLLPVIIGGSVQGEKFARPLIIAASLAVSLILFTLLLKASTIFIDIPQQFWKNLSGGIVLFFWVITLFPSIWERVSERLSFSSGSNKLLQASSEKPGILGAISVGFAMGPVFSSCSPTYALILATVLPQSFALGLVHLTLYAAGLSLMLLIIGIFGQRAVAKAKWAANPHGIFKKVLGILFLLVGLAIITGYDKKFEAALLDA